MNFLLLEGDGHWNFRMLCSRDIEVSEVVKNLVSRSLSILLSGLAAHVFQREFASF